jgi:hypothetical protein
MLPRVDLKNGVVTASFRRDNLTHEYDLTRKEAKERFDDDLGE